MDLRQTQVSQSGLGETKSCGADEAAVHETVKDRAQCCDVSGTDVLCDHRQTFGLLGS